MIAGLLLANAAQAQQDRGEPADSADACVTTLGEVRALKPEDDVPVDLYRFKSPVQPEPNAFNRAWHEPPSLQEVGMRGGYLMMGINYGIAKTAQGLHTLTRAPDPIQSAIARPPPGLDAAQQRRALQFCDPQQGCAVPTGD
ncbi:hypothetical protein [Stenotrophomonas sp. SrG]|uniref:hypothetical protein n=1 Tax=Stenotrophomonas sp. SrG TaxID=3414430 RepID=UPI003CF3F2F0